ncbi:hypothetical protein G9A89_000010 [Geosiphon pyriformis]|nr:hypothetical protein G9A89_000010 [Geosiphon pyriformis]
MVLGKLSTPSKFSEIIYASFTSEASLGQAIEKARAANILVNTNLKKSTGHLDWTVVIKKIPVGTSAEAVCTVLSEFGIIKSIKIQLVELWQKAVVEFEQLNYVDLVTAEWFILIGKNAMYFVRSVDEKTCVINCHLVIYARIRCAVVCFNSAESLDAAIGTTLVLRSTNLHWSSLVSARYAKCEKLGHMLLSCVESGKISFSSSFCKVLLDVNKRRLTAIYAKQFAPIAHPISFGGLFWIKIASSSSSLSFSGQVVSVNVGSFLEIKPSLLVVNEINVRFATLKHSLTSFTEHVNKLAKRLKTPEPTISQLSPGCQSLVTPSLQNQEADIVMSEGSGVATGGETVVKVRTSTNNNHLKVAESEIIRANHIRFAKFLFQQYSQQLELNNNHFPAELAFNFYINDKITDCLKEIVNIESASENFYTELFQHTSLPRNYSFTSIIREINQTIERYTQQQFPITYVNKGKRRLQTPTVILKQIQPFTWKKTRVESPINSSYYYIPRSTINISSTGTFILYVTSTFGQFLFQSKQKKAELLETYEIIKSEGEQEKKAKNQEFTYQNLILENLEVETLNIKTQQTQNNPNTEAINQQNLSSIFIID